MARKAARVDDNQGVIVEALRGAGASVQSLAATGKGCPDLLIGYRGANVLAEVKDGDKIPSKRRLTDDQVKWHSRWKGQVAVVESSKEALQLLVDIGTEQVRMFCDKWAEAKAREVD